MIDTIKIYTEINEKMYKKINDLSVYKSALDKKTGLLVYEITNSNLEGSYSSSLSVKVDCGSKYRFVKKGFYISIEGSYHKLKKGYNSHYGYTDLHFISKELIRFVSHYYNIDLPNYKKWYLYRADVAICFDLNNQKNVSNYINNLNNCNYPRRKMKFYKDESIYITGSFSTLKIYNKYLEFRKHDLKKFRDTNFDLISYFDKIKGFIRFECEIKKRYLQNYFKKEGHILIKDVKYEDLYKIWECDFMRLLKMVENEKELIEKKEDVFKVLQENYKSCKTIRLYNFYILVSSEGIENVKRKVCKSVYYENLKELKNLGIDISQKYEINFINNNRIKFNPFIAAQVA